MSWRIDPAETGLLVIDVQEKLLPAIAESPQVLRKIAALAELARLFEIPIFVTEQVPEKLGPTARELKLTTPAIPKRAFSAAAALAPLIEARTLPKTLLVCGLETHICVRQTVYDLRAGGRNIVVVGDAVGSRNPVDRDLALAEMRADKVLIPSVEALGWELTGSIDSPHFKAMLALLK